MLSKDDIKKCCLELKEMVENQLLNKDDNWLKLPCWGNNKISNFDVLINQIKHFDIMLDIVNQFLETIILIQKNIQNILDK